MGKAGASVAIVLLTALVPLAFASPAALDATVVAVPPSVDPATGQIGTRGGYLNVVSYVDVDGTLTLVNADISGHDIIAKDHGPADNPWCARFAAHGDCPLFASPLARLGGEAVVQGTDQLVPGTTYEFYCSIHHWMTGTLVAI